MSPAPLLTRRDLAAELKLIHASRHRSPHTAFYGEPDADLLGNRVVPVPVDGADRRFFVTPVRSELELRWALSHAQADEPLALLLGYGDRVPYDVEARLAKGGVRHIDRGRRLAARFEARGASPDLLAQPALVEALLDLGQGFPRCPGLTVDVDAAWRALLGALTPLGEGTPSEDGVLVLAALHGGGPDFVRRCDTWPALRPALHAWLARVAGPVARVAWRAWELDEGPRAAALTFVLQAAAEGLAAGRHDYLAGLLPAVLERIDPELKAEVAAHRFDLARWGELADRVWLGLQRVPGAAPEILRRAEEAFPRHPKVDEALERSTYLPRSFERAEDALAEALIGAVADATRPALDAAIAAKRRLDAHRLSAGEAARPVAARAEMALRLLAWRLRRGDHAERIDARPPVEQAPAIAAAYAAEGGFVDRARHALRGAGADALGKAFAAVLELADGLRDAEDARFAHALDAWTSRGRPAGEAIPIEAVLQDLAVKFLKDRPARRLLVLLMDGMSWERAVELILDLENHAYAPIAEHLALKGMRPVVAALPTLTDVSRSALFAGKLVKAGEQRSASGDVERFAAHKGFAALGLSPRLLLGGDAVARDGAATKQALDLVASADRAVGVVLNAIDDSLSAAGHLKMALTVDGIPALRDLLRAARFAGRAVLLVADHGHVPGARFGAPVAQGDGGTRWRKLRLEEAPGTREIVLSGPCVWRPLGVDRLALLFAETDCYGSGPREGEHGGAALAEVVAPAVLVGAEDLARVAELQGTPDEGLEVRPFPRPAFWDLALGAASSSQAPTRKTRDPKPSRKQQSESLQLPHVAPPPSAPPAPVAAAAPARPPAVERLEASELFRTMLAQRPKASRENVLRAVTVLLEAGGQLPPELFAARYGVLPGRVSGVVSVLSEVLNVDGYPVLTFDHVGRSVRLDDAKLEAVFAV